MFRKVKTIIIQFLLDTQLNTAEHILNFSCGLV